MTFLIQRQRQLREKYMYSATVIKYLVMLWFVMTLLIKTFKACLYIFYFQWGHISIQKSAWLSQKYLVGGKQG